MGDEPTCGQGLAARSDLPTKLGALMAALADVLEHHATTLDVGDDAGRGEERAYRSLLSRHREAAAVLLATGREMAGCRDLPMAGHDVSALSSAEALEVFTRSVAVERELSELLGRRLTEDDAMLDRMRPV